MLVRKVRQNGSIKWKGVKAFVSESQVGEALELQEMEGDVWDVYLCKYLVGRLKSGKTAFQTRKNVKDIPGFVCKGCLRFYKSVRLRSQAD